MAAGKSEASNTVRGSLNRIKHCAILGAVLVLWFGAGHVAAAGGSWSVLVPTPSVPTFYQPATIAVGADATVYVYNADARTIQVIPASGTIPQPWHLPASVKKVSGLAVDSQGRIYLAMGDATVIKSFSADGRPLATLAIGRTDGIGIDSHDVLYALQTIKGKSQVTRFSLAGKQLGALPMAIKKKVDTNPQPYALVVGPDGALLVSYLGTTGEGKSYNTVEYLQKWSPAGKLLVESDNDYPRMALAPDETVFATVGGAIYRLKSDLRVATTWNGSSVCPPTDAESGEVGIAIDRAGNVYVTDLPMNTVQKRSPAGQVLKVWGSCPLSTAPAGVAVTENGTIVTSGDAPVDRTLKAVVDKITLYSPDGKTVTSWNAAGSGDVALDRQGNMYIPQARPVYGVAKYSPSGKLLKSFPGPKNTSPPSLERRISGVAVDSKGNVYAAFIHANHILKYSPAGTLVATWGSQGEKLGQFAEPEGLGVDAQDNLYVADSVNYRVQELSSSGKALRQWAMKFSSGSHYPNYPKDVAVDARGNLWISGTSAFGDGVVELSPSGNLLGSWVRAPSSVPGSFHDPYGIAVARTGQVYVADTSNDRIQVHSGP